MKNRSILNLMVIMVMVTACQLGTPGTLDLTATPTLPVINQSPQDADDCMVVIARNDGLSVSPATTINDDCVQIASGNVTVTYNNAPADFVEATFYIQSASGNIDVIGVDTDPSDGASVDYTVSSAFSRGLLYTFIAVAPGNSIESGQLALYRGG